MRFPQIFEDVCEAQPECADGRCVQDPSFPRENPEACSGRLVLKPEALTVCLLDQVTLKTFVETADGEQQVTAGVRYFSSNAAVLSVDPFTGISTSVAPGIASIMAKWQDQRAFSQVTVLPGDDCCADTTVMSVLCIDDSKSMEQEFGDYWPTKLDLAKHIGAAIAGNLAEKDLMAVVEFSECAMMNSALVNDPVVVQGAIDVIAQEQGLTNITSAVELALFILATETQAVPVFGQPNVTIINNVTNITTTGTGGQEVWWGHYGGVEPVFVPPLNRGVAHDLDAPFQTWNWNGEALKWE